MSMTPATGRAFRRESAPRFAEVAVPVGLEALGNRGPGPALVSDGVCTLHGIDPTDCNGVFARRDIAKSPSEDGFVVFALPTFDETPRCRRDTFHVATFGNRF